MAHHVGEQTGGGPHARPSGGFTLIELMVVVAIIAILALMALPNMTGRLARAQVTEAMPLADVAKPPLAAAWAAQAPWPADNAAAGLPPADRIVSDLVESVAVQGGAIHLTFGNRANGALKGKVLTLRAAVVEHTPVVPITWVCGHADAPKNMVLQGDDRTTVPAAYLPPRCAASK